MTRALVLVVWLISFPLCAQTQHEVDAEIAAFKESASKGCYVLGQQLGHPLEKIEEFCKCRTKAVDDALSDDQWKEFGAAMVRRDERHIRAALTQVLAHAQKVCGAPST